MVWHMRYTVVVNWKSKRLPNYTRSTGGGQRINRFIRLVQQFVINGGVSYYENIVIYGLNTTATLCRWHFQMHTPMAHISILIKISSYSSHRNELDNESEFGRLEIMSWFRTGTGHNLTNNYFGHCYSYPSQVLACYVLTINIVDVRMYLVALDNFRHVLCTHSLTTHTQPNKWYIVPKKQIFLSDRWL